MPLNYPRAPAFPFRSPPATNIIHCSTWHIHLPLSSFALILHIILLTSYRHHAASTTKSETSLRPSSASHCLGGHASPSRACQNPSTRASQIASTSPLEYILVSSQAISQHLLSHEALPYASLASDGLFAKDCITQIHDFAKSLVRRQSKGKHESEHP